MAESALSAEGSRTQGRRLQGTPRGSQRECSQDSDRRCRSLEAWSQKTAPPRFLHILLVKEVAAQVQTPGSPWPELLGEADLEGDQHIPPTHHVGPANQTGVRLPISPLLCVSPHLPLARSCNSHRSCTLEEVTPLKLPSMLSCDSECPSAWVLSVTPFHR